MGALHCINAPYKINDRTAVIIMPKTIAPIPKPRTIALNPNKLSKVRLQGIDHEP